MVAEFSVTDQYTIDSHTLKVNTSTPENETEETLFTIGEDVIYGYAKVTDSSGDPVNGVDLELSQIDPNGSIRDTRPSDVEAALLTEADGWSSRGIAFDSRPPKGSGWIQRASVKTAHNGNTGSNDQLISMLSAFTANKNISILMGPVNGVPNTIDGVVPTNGEHLKKGDRVLMGFAFLFSGVRTRVDTDTVPRFRIDRFNQTSSKVETLQSDLTWKASGDAGYAEHFFDFKTEVENLEWVASFGTAGQGVTTSNGYVVDTATWPAGLVVVTVKFKYESQEFLDDEYFYMIDGTITRQHVAHPIAEDLTVTQYYKNNALEATAISDGGTAYVRSATTLKVIGAKGENNEVSVTWDGVTYTESDPELTTPTSTTWEFAGPVGTETSGKTLSVSQPGQVSRSVTVVVDRTVPVIDNFAFTGMTVGTASGTPMYRGEYVKWTWTTSDANSGIQNVTFSYPDGDFLTGEPSSGTAASTTGYIRTSSSTPVTGTRRITITAIDRAGNTSTADITAHFEALPAVPGFASVADHKGNESPFTLYTTDFGITSYDDNTAGVTASLSAALEDCRNSAIDDTYIRIASGTLAIATGTLNDIAGNVGPHVLNSNVSSQSSGLAKNVTVSYGDQYYQTDSTTVGNYDYNAQKNNDINNDPTLISFGDLGLNNSDVESFYDADTARIIAQSGLTIIDGFAKATANGAQVSARISLTANNAGNDQYAIRMRGPSGEVSEIDGFTVEWKTTAASTWNTVTSGTTFTGPVGAAALDVRLTWSLSTDPDIEVISVGYIE